MSPFNEANTVEAYIKDSLWCCSYRKTADWGSLNMRTNYVVLVGTTYRANTFHESLKKYLSRIISERHY